jgi:hypothetical protein
MTIDGAMTGQAFLAYVERSSSTMRIGPAQPRPPFANADRIM